MVGWKLVKDESEGMEQWAVVVPMVMGIEKERDWRMVKE